MAAAAAAAPAAADATAIIKIPRVQSMLLDAVALIHTQLYTKQEAVRALIGEAPSAFLPSYRFFIKGGAAAPILADYYAGSLRTDAMLDIDQDIDCTLLIDRRMGHDAFTLSRREYFRTILKTLLAFLNGDAMVRDAGDLRRDMEAAGYVLETGGRDVPVDVHEEGITRDDMEERMFDFYEFLADKTTPSACPFKLVVHPNLQYRDEVLHLALVSVVARVRDQDISVLEISVPKYSHPGYDYEWTANAHLLYIPYPFNAPTHRLPVAPAVATYIDQRIAAALDTRENKRTRRTRRANTLRAFLRGDAAQRNEIAYVRGLAHTFKNGRTPANVLRNLNTETSAPATATAAPRETMHGLPVVYLVPSENGRSYRTSPFPPARGTGAAAAAAPRTRRSSRKHRKNRHAAAHYRRK